MWSSSTVMFGWLRHRGEQRALDLAAGDVLPVHDAVVGVGALAAEVELAAGGSAPSRTPTSSRRWTCAGPCGDAQLDDVAIAQAVARDQRVLDVLLEAVVRRQHRGDAALRPVGVGVVRRASW